MRNRKSRILIAIILLCASLSKAQPFILPVDSLIRIITTESYRSHFDSIRTLPTNFRKVMPGKQQSADHDACRDYVLRTFQKNLGNENCYLHRFESGSYGGLANVVGVKLGNNKEKGIWIVSAHYDSNNNNQANYSKIDISPGANDNGTGIAALLEIASVLRNIDTEATVILVAWDMEEIFTDGYGTGSNKWFQEFVKRKPPTNWNDIGNRGNINRNDIQGNINFDMFGNPQTFDDGKPVLWACYAKDNQQYFTQDYAKTVNQYIPEIKAVSYGRLIWSDHYTFAAQKIPSVENLESNYLNDPYYHTYSDHSQNADNIDFKFAANVTKGGLAFLLENILKVNKRANGAKSDFICKSETANYYCFETNSANAYVQIYSQFGKLINEEEQQSFFFNPPADGLYYIKINDEKGYRKQIIYLHKKEGLF